MQIKAANLHGSEKEIIISVDPKEMDKFLNRASDKLSQGLAIKGFRKGNIPRKVAEGAIGKEIIWQEAVQQAVPEIYWDALEQENIIPLSHPRVDILKSVPGNELEFKVLIPVMPIINLPDYKSIAKNVILKKTKEIKIEDKEVDESLKWLQHSKVKTNKASKNLSEPNDEFVKKLGNFNNLSELKESIRSGLKQEKEIQEKQKIRLEILEKIAKKIDFPMSDILIEDEIDKIQDEFSQQISSMDTTLEDYLKKIGKTIKEVREGWKEKAKERVSFSIVLKAIADKENIVPTEEELEEEVNKHLSRFENTQDIKLDVNQLKMYISSILKNEKVFQFLESN